MDFSDVNWESNGRQTSSICKKKNNRLSLHQRCVGLFLVDLVTDVVDVRGEVVLGVVVDDVTDIREGHILKYAIFQVF